MFESFLVLFIIGIYTYDAFIMYFVLTHPGSGVIWLVHLQSNKFAASRRPISRDRDLPSKRLSKHFTQARSDSCEEPGEGPTPVASKGKTGQTMTAAPTSLYLL